jgi:hypothetical protein
MPTNRRTKIPAHLEEAAAELVALTIAEGKPLKLPGGGVISNEVSNACTCKCWISGDISGPAQLNQGAKATYTLVETKPVVGQTLACTECKHDDTDWASGNKDCTITNPKSGSCEVNVAQKVPKKTKFTLTATPKAHCNCKDSAGAVKKIDCSSTAQSVEIEVV